jgi:5-oxoprolinase (ATP-hydrolysing)
MTPWKIWIDTGGTFTDSLCINPQGEWSRLKVLSNGAVRGKAIRVIASNKFVVEIFWPHQQDIFGGYSVTFPGTRLRSVRIATVDPISGTVTTVQPIPDVQVGSTIELTTHEEVPVFAARLLTQTKLGEAFPPIELKLGSTRGTNAILEGKGARTALIVTKGFRDLLMIGNQQRPDLFALQVIKAPVLYHSVIEVNERVDAQGKILCPWRDHEIENVIRMLRAKRIESVAIAFLNSYRNPSHELRVKSLLMSNGFRFVSCSNELSSQVRLLQRSETAVANAYLDPIINTYVKNITEGLGQLNLRLMASSGGLLDANSFHPKDSLLSGPAGGVVGASIVAGRSGFKKIITFDMGGTSTDVSRYDHRFDYRFESAVGSIRILSPSLAIETIAAGGGSICDFDGHRFIVGPHSAGASPGPACYGAGGPLTITDVNLLLGRIDQSAFAMPLSFEAAERALRDLLQKVRRGNQRAPSKAQVLLSLIQIANEKMAEAIRKVSTQAGHDPADFTLLSFGGAGGQHACALSAILKMKSVLVPYDAGLLSAFGIGHARQEKFAEKLLLQPLDKSFRLLDGYFQMLVQQAAAQLQAEGHQLQTISTDRKLLYLRFAGQESTIECEVGSPFTLGEITNQFRKKYTGIYSYWPEDRSIEVESMRVIAGVGDALQHVTQQSVSTYSASAERQVAMITGAGKIMADCFAWERLHPGARITGPAIITSRNSTTVVDAGWEFSIDGNNSGIMQAVASVRQKGQHSHEAALELFTNRFTAVAEQMGAMLQRTSFSVNIKERLDFSCALHDAKGYLVVNAPHIPVHLGSLGICVREVIKQIKPREGDVIITNHPRFGGSHLPDVTLIKGVFAGTELIGYVSNRAHHAEIGGRKPGSMPADATTLEEEGVIIPPMYLIRNGEPQWKMVEAIFTNSRYPTRTWSENQADLNGALAAVNFGENAMHGMCNTYGKKEVKRYMKMLRTHASNLLGERLRLMPDKNTRAREKLDDGNRLVVTITKRRQQLDIDFAGTSPVHPGNLNATTAIVQSVVLYVLRLLINTPIPMNEGLMDRVKLHIPKCLLDPFNGGESMPAVVGGNTEVSQRLTDTLIKAFALSACSQGTMNNFLFGNNRFGYYETICGGTGAGQGFNGCDAVHHHMTNTRITDPELLEWRYPVRLLQFSIRKNSGGKGKWHGGNGIIREFEFLEPLEVNLLSQHRVEEPFGMKGGKPGKTGRQWIMRSNGHKEKLGGMDSASVYPGDKVVIETPGGGGWGKAISR